MVVKEMVSKEEEEEKEEEEHHLSLTLEIGGESLKCRRAA